MVSRRRPTFGDWSQIYQLPSGTPLRRFNPYFRLPVRPRLSDTNLVYARPKSGLTPSSGKVKVIPIAITSKRSKAFYEQRQNLPMPWAYDNRRMVLLVLPTIILDVGVRHVSPQVWAGSFHGV